MSDFAHSRLLRRLLWALRLRGPAVGEPTAQTLNVLTMVLLCLLATHIGLAEYNNPDKLVITLLAIPALLTPVATLVLLRRGAVRASGIVYLSGMWVYFTAVIMLNGGIHHMGLAVYISLSVSAAWLFGYGAALLMAAICFAAILVMAILETYVVGPWHVLPGTAMGVLFFVTESILMGVVPVTTVLSSLRRALDQSQQAQAELQVQQQHLEELVRDRTVELVEARDQALAANRAKSAFLAHMSHELRNPLSSILGIVSLLRDEVLSVEQRDYVEMIDRSGEHLLNIINDVLDMAKIEAGKLDVAAVAFDVVTLVDEVAEMMRVKATAKKLVLVCHCAPDLQRYVRADAAKLRQVLINLLGNAVKFTDAGVVTLRVSAGPAEDLSPLRLRFEVEDTGIGIAPEDQARIFEAFVRAGKQRGQKGTGLGLAITRHFVTVMGGAITVESGPGRGSRFTVEIPAEVAAEEEVPVARSDSDNVYALTTDQPECRVMVVEDDPENALIMKQMLCRAGFQVRVVESGTRGIEIFPEWRPHFVWMDLRMPEMSGIETARRIRELSGGRKVKIAAVTASAFASERAEVLAAGMDDFIRKPYRAGDIFGCMGRLLGVKIPGESPPRLHESKSAITSTGE